MKTKLKTSNDDPRTLTRTLFQAPFNPTVNFAIEDPLLLGSHPAVQKEGLAYAKYFCSGSPLSAKFPQYLERKLSVEEDFSKKAGFEKSLILRALDAPLELIEKSFLSTQKFFVPDSIKTPFAAGNTIYFSHGNPRSLLTLMELAKVDHDPIVYIPKLSSAHGRADFSVYAEMKKERSFFLLVEDSHTFGLEGLDGFAPKSEMQGVDLLITHIPKTFGSMLTVLSGSFPLLDTLLEFSFSGTKCYPPAPFIGMLGACLELLPSMQERRDQVKSFITKLGQRSLPTTSICSPLVTIKLRSTDEKGLFTKSLTDKGFLLPSSSFKHDDLTLTFHINHLLDETAIHSLSELNDISHKQIICESI